MPSFAGLTLDRPRLMGILNVTPDSFHDGGRFATVQAAINAGLRLISQGADIVDVGGESTRPGAVPVAVEHEIARIVPVVEGLARAGALVSVDTRNSATMRRAIDAGARIVNDVSALIHDRASLGVVAASDAAVVLMHMRGTPEDMNQHAQYDDVAGEVAEWLGSRAEACAAAGIARDRIALDPGLGFAKTAEQSLALVEGIARILGLGYPVLVGASRKSFLKRLGGGETPAQRLEASLAVAVRLARAGVHILRVHDVADTVRALERAGLAGTKLA